MKISAFFLDHSRGILIGISAAFNNELKTWSVFDPSRETGNIPEEARKIHDERIYSAFTVV